MHARFGQIMNNKIQKGQNPTAAFDWGWGGRSRVLRMIPAHSTTEGVGRPPKPPLRPDPPLPSPYLRNQLTHAPSLGSEQGHLFLVLTPSCCSMSSSKALPKFLIWPLINFC